MWEYQIRNRETNEQDFMWGYNEFDAWSRRPDLDRTKWVITYREYID